MGGFRYDCNSLSEILLHLNRFGVSLAIRLVSPLCKTLSQQAFRCPIFVVKNVLCTVCAQAISQRTSQPVFLPCYVAPVDAP